MFVFCYADALVFYRNGYFRFRFCNHCFYLFALRSIFEGIGQQVEQNLFQFVRICPDVEGGKLRLQPEVYLVFVGQIVEAFHNVSGKGNQIYLLHPHLHFVVLYFTEVQYLVHKTEHAAGIPFYQ